MKRLSFLSALLFICFSFGLKAQQVHSLWVNTPPVIDGNPSEWPQPFRYYDGNTKLQFSIANDSNNIYICLKVTDEQAQIKIFRAGINVWMDPKGKKKESVGINFPTKQERTEGEESSPRHQRQNADAELGNQKPQINKLKQHALLDQTILAIKGFTGVPDQVLPLKNNFGINAAANWDSLDILCIEYKIPIASAMGHNLSLTDTIKPVGFGFIVNGISGGNTGHKSEGDEEAGNSSNAGGMGRGSGMGGGMGGMGGGMGGGRMGGGGGRGGMGGGHSSMGEVNPMTQEQKIWTKVVLAFK